MQLDLRDTANLPRIYAVQLDEIAEELRRPYTELVQSISAPYGNSLDWWVTPLASRNTYICPLFDRLCRAVLAQRVIATDPTKDVIVDHPVLGHLLQEILPSSVNVICTMSHWRWRFRATATVMRRLLISIWMVVGRIFFSKFVQLVSKDLPLEPIISLDTNIYPESIQHGTFSDRHYPGILDTLLESERKIVYWTPSFYGVRDYLKLFRSLRKCQDNLLIPDDYLQVIDYIYAISHILRVPRKVKTCNFLGINVTELVNGACVENLANLGSVEALLRYRFVKRLSLKGIKVRRVIEWFENQEVDHGSVAGWREFFPNTSVVGYQGFLAARTYLCMFPLALENQIQLIPNIIAVMGATLVEPAKEFCHNLRVVIAPAFRFQKVWLKRSVAPDPKYFTILVTLPVMKLESASIISMVTHAIKLITGEISRPCRILVKHHPATSRTAVQQDVFKFPQNFSAIDDDLFKILDQVNMLISAASSTCVQAIARGVPVAIVGKPGFPTQNPIPKIVPKDLWRVCYNPIDLTTAVCFYANLNIARVNELMTLGSNCRSELFEQVTRIAVTGFLGLDGSDIKSY
jgi:hypothetical protein